MKALVTGGGGFLGLYIIEQLVAEGTTVSAFCRNAYSALDELGVKTIQGDVRDATAVANACHNQDIVLHVAAVPGVWGPWKKFYEINTLGTQNVISGCLKHGVPKLIFTSSPSVIYDGQPHENANEELPYPPEASYLCHYPHSKALAEQEVLAANCDNLTTVALRPHLIWGPRDNHLIPRLIQRAKSGRLRQVGEGDNLISMAYVENVAAAHLQVAKVLSPESAVAGKAYFINEAEPVNLWVWIAELLKEAGLPPVKKQVTAKTAWKIGGILEAIYRVAHLPGEPPMTRFVASQLSSSHYYDISRAKRDFGYQPIITYAEAMDKLRPELQQLGRQ